MMTVGVVISVAVVVGAVISVVVMAKVVTVFEMVLVVVIAVAAVFVVAILVMVEVVLAIALLVIVVVVIVVVGRALMCTGSVIDTFVEVLTVGMRVDVLIVTSNVAVDLLMDALTDIRLGLLANNIGVGVLGDVNVNVFLGVSTVFEFARSETVEDFRC